jgi:hypothetical protein
MYEEFRMMVKSEMRKARTDQFELGGTALWVFRTNTPRPFSISVRHSIFDWDFEMKKHLHVCVGFAFLLATGVYAPARLDAGFIDLEWRPAHVVVTPGEIVRLQLFAVSQDEVDDVISVMDVIFLWDPAYLSLLGVVNDGPYAWNSSGLPPNALGGLNQDLTDGDALYTARSQFPPNLPAHATSSGLHAATIEFLALAEISSTGVPIVEERNGAETLVVSDIPGLDVSDNLGGAEITVMDCLLFDFDQDGDVDLRDYQSLQRCMGGAIEPAERNACLCSFDADRNGAIETSDYTTFNAAITGPG